MKLSFQPYKVLLKQTLYVAVALFFVQTVSGIQEGNEVQVVDESDFNVYASDAVMSSSTGALGLLSSAALGRKTCRTMRKIPLSKAGLTAAQQSLGSSTRKGTSKVRGASAPPATAVMGSASASPQAEKEAAQGLGQLHGEVTPPRTSSGAQPAVPLKLKFELRRSGG